MRIESEGRRLREEKSGEGGRQRGDRGSPGAEEGERGKTTVLPLRPPRTRDVGAAVMQVATPRQSSSADRLEGSR